MKYGMVWLDSIQEEITETTLVWGSTVSDNWKMIQDIPELRDFLTLCQPGGNVVIAVLNLMVQGNNKIITSGRTDMADNIVVSNTSTQLSEGGEDGDDGGIIAFQR